MNKFLIISILTTLFSCAQKTSNNEPATTDRLRSKTEIIDTGNISDRLKSHFELYKIKPSEVINNREGDQTHIRLGNHKIQWLNAEDETKISIDHDFFTLKDKTTLNIVWDNKDSVDFANNWDEIKLFRHNDKEYIGIRMSLSPCTGLGCSVSYFLIYDVATKTKNFFGTFRNDDNLELFDFSNDDKIDYVAKTFKGDAHGSTPMEFIYELYSMEKGQFKELKDKIGTTFQIKYTIFPNDVTIKEELKENWITKIK